MIAASGLKVRKTFSPVLEVKRQAVIAPGAEKSAWQKRGIASNVKKNDKSPVASAKVELRGRSKCQSRER